MGPPKAPCGRYSQEFPVFSLFNRELWRHTATLREQEEVKSGRSRGGTVVRPGFYRQSQLCGRSPRLLARGPEKLPRGHAKGIVLQALSEQPAHFAISRLRTPSFSVASIIL